MKKHEFIRYVFMCIAILGCQELARGQTSYCTANASYQAQYIASVQVGSIYHISLLSPGGYEKDTVLWTAMTIGTGYPVTVTNGFGFSTDQCKIWIDWNQDKDFNDANETITMTGSPGLGPYTATITPPVAALIGNTRMRVRLSAAGTFSACGTTMYGETEDYTINVGGTPPVNDIGVINITQPVTGTNLGANETVKVLINNFGTTAQTGFPVTFHVTDNAPVTETVTASIPSGTNYLYTFTQKANMSGVGVTYALKAYTGLTGDENNYNDTTSRNIFHGWAQYQKVVQGEYFINTDPGEGLGTPIAGTYNLVDVTVNISNMNLPAGSTLYVRFKSTSGKWSSPRSFKRGNYLPNPNAQLASAEYFINTDPGEGMGTGVTISGGISNMNNINLPVGSTLYYRAKDNMGRWSKPRGIKRLDFYPNQNATLNYAEYFINTDPGMGNGIPVSLSGGVINITNLDLPVGSRVYVRVKDNLNRWSQPYGVIRYVYYSIQGAGLAYAEYFIDTDPGQGNATPVTITDGIMNLSDFNLPVGSVIYIRVKDNYNRWSLPKGYERPAVIPTPGSVLAVGEYYFDQDPGKGSGLPLAFSNGVAQISDLELQKGDILYVRAKDDYNRWGPSRALKYHFKDMQHADYKIKLASDGSTTLPLPMELYPDPDSSCAWIAEADSLTWHTNDSIWVRFQDEDGFYTNWRLGIVANAGEDQTICAGEYATLTGSGGSSYLWSTGQAGATIMVNPLIITQYWVLIGDGAGGSSTDSVMVFVGPVPEAPGPVSGMSEVCAGSTVTVYTVPVIQGAETYSWTLPEGASGNSATNSIQATFSDTAVDGNISVRGVNNCGEGPASSLPVEVNTLIAGPAGAITGPSGVCRNTNDIAYAVPVISNASSYLWTLPDGITGNSTTNVIMVDIGPAFSQGTITARGVNSCGEGLPASLLVSGFNPPGPAGSITGEESVCLGQSAVLYTVPIIANAIGYNWLLPEGATIVSGANTYAILVDYSTSAVSGIIKVQGTNGCGTGAFSPEFNVTVNNLPTQPNAIAGPTLPCPFTVQLYSVLQEPGVSYTWSFPADWVIQEGQGTASIHVITGETGGSIEAVPWNLCGAGLAVAMSVHMADTDTLIWTGIGGADWNNPANWEGCGLPNLMVDVIIPDVAPNPFPVIASEVYCKTLTLDNDAFITIMTPGVLIIGNEP